MKAKKLFRMVPAILILISFMLTGGAAKSQPNSKEHEQGMNILKQALTPAQIKVIRDFAKAHRAERRQALEKSLEWDEAILKALDDFNLSEDQEKKLIEIVSSRVDLLVPTVEPLMNDGITLRNAVIADEIDEQEILDLSAQLSADIGQAAITVSAMVQEARQILTPDQLAIIEGLYQKALAEDQVSPEEMSEQMDEALAFYQALDIRPEQIDLLITLGKPLKKMQEERQKREEQRIWRKLGKILTEEQIGILKAYIEPRKQEMEEKGPAEEEKALELWYEFGITKDQMDELVELLAGEKEDIIATSQATAQASEALRDAVLAQNPDSAKILEAAGLLGDSIGGAALLAGKMAAQAKQILTPEQLQLLLSQLEPGDAEMRTHLSEAPNELQSLLNLYDQLNLTPEQKAKLLDWIKADIKKDEKRIKRMLNSPEPGF